MSFIGKIFGKAPEPAETVAAKDVRVAATAARLPDGPYTEIPDAELEQIYGDDQDDYLATGKRDYGRFRFDDRLMDFVVTVANKPRLLVASTFGVMIGCGMAYAVIENHGPIEGMWWAIVTGFTVGYGDQYPVTTAGRGIGAILIVSMFVLALCLGAQITSRLIEDKDEFTNGEQENMKATLARIETALATGTAKTNCACGHTCDTNVTPAHKDDTPDA